MQVDFPSRHSNVIYDDAHGASKSITGYDTSRRTPTGFQKERSSSEYTSTRRIGGNRLDGIGNSSTNNSYERGPSKH
jgi:hypothetical protein